MTSHRTNYFAGLTLIFGLLFGGVHPLAVAHASLNRSTITFENRSGEAAVVKLVSAATRMVSVPNGRSATVNVSGGRYQIFVRYGAGPNYSYSKGESFTVEEDAGGYSEITITLHKVAGGNYGSRPSNKEEFDRAN